MATLWMMALTGGSVVGLACLVLLTWLVRGWGCRGPIGWRLDLPRPVAGAHRGGMALRPENTLEAFAHARRLGCRFLELDVHLTRDCRVVVIHDPTVDRTTDGRGPVAGFTWDELQKLDAGFRFSAPDGETWRGRGVKVPALDAVLAAFPDCTFSVDIKTANPAVFPALAQVIEQTATRGRVIAGAEAHCRYLRWRRTASGHPAFFTRVSGGLFWLFTLLGLSGLLKPCQQTLQIPEYSGPIPLVTPRLLAAARRHGLPVLVWTVNDPAHMRRLLDLGVDGILTDRPDLLMRVIREFSTAKANLQA
ncbi:MAG: glycerophosphodiester phosphodiesterase [Deltaproteobacteria bacterium]|nr:glycerophosphodiester phosphodiesterase [Deltaproteobacteria bacterium]